MQVGVGLTRDVVLVRGVIEVLAAVPEPLGDVFAAKTGFDPRTLIGYAYFRLQPVSIQAWREEDELAGRWVMRGGTWR